VIIQGLQSRVPDVQCDVPLFETHPNTNKTRDFGVLSSSKWEEKISADHLNINDVYVFRINTPMSVGRSQSTYGNIHKNSAVSSIHFTPSEDNSTKHTLREPVIFLFMLSTFLE
jgi:hypothetical protein